MASPRSAPAPGVAGELTAVPFFPQERYQCGPAALATVLAYSGTRVEPQALVPRVYLPGRHGSLQDELIAATRQFDRVPYRLDPALDAIEAEVRGGRPVLVLQNLGLRWIPRWHYAVVVGIDRDARQLVLRSGTHERLAMSERRFLASWSRADHWALVALPPGQLPARADPVRLIAAAAALEAVGRVAAAGEAYRAITQRWPDESAGWLGLGNTEYRLGAAGAAERAYREALRVGGERAPVLNNLAQVLADRGCADAALALLGRARRAPDAEEFLAAIEATTRDAAATRGRAGSTCPGSEEDRRSSEAR